MHGEEIKLAILEEEARVASTNSEFNYENVWNNLAEKDEKFSHEGPDSNSCYNITYKGYKFLIDANKVVTYIGEQEDNPHTGTAMEEKGTEVIDGKTYKKYEIWNKAQLENFRDRVNSGDTFEDSIITQKANINLNNEEWEPIGHGTPNEDIDKYFSGIYDGENLTISGIYINNNKMYQALFGDIWTDSTRKNSNN